MISLVVAAFLLAGASGCGVPAIPPLMHRIVGGMEAVPHSWPWQISFQYLNNSRWQHNCGGSLIADNWVMTAAHCIHENWTYRVVLGKHNLEVSETESVAIEIAPRNIFIHKNWNPFFLTNGYDIALIKLTSPVTLSKEIDVTCIPKAGTLLPNNYQCYATGWGRLYTFGPIPDKLQQVPLLVVDHATCSKSDWWGDISNKLVCAGGDGITSTCLGDSGGPLNCRGADKRWEVHGITSFGSAYSCNLKNRPSVFTRVSAFNDWISQIMVNN
ncbi:chymotrypsin-like elastase family member 2A isoform X2 [Hypanus sabinus]|uniref:chymotrypsin-like elastase family member 2A isoform X2 n=1 Tax=Hypanus sabinus TaxID=79690 RepID=UPI0028C413C1|nr:chymotrypsin-like elastase family member 2A isoform X2 [Hypanus sabinus]